MLRKWLILLLSLGLSSFSSFSQKTESPQPAKTQEQKEKENQIKSQAIGVLKDCLSKNKSIANLRQRADVVAEASSVLWNYDTTTAKESLIGFIEQLVKDFSELSSNDKRTGDAQKQVGNIEYAIKKCLNALTTKDVKDANLLQSRFFKIREENLKVKNLNEELFLAAEGLEVDEQRTVTMLSALIQQGIPGHFPKLIYDLREKNRVVADILVKRAIQNLSSAPNYKMSDAIYLSVVVFSEETAMIPWMEDVKKPNDSGVLFNYFGPAKKSAIDNENITAFYSAFPQFFESRIVNQTGNLLTSPLPLIESYYLIEKLRAYSQIYTQINSTVLDRLQTVLTTPIQEAGFTEDTLASFRGYAQRIGTSKNPIEIDDGTRALEYAENAKTPEEKQDRTINAIIQLIQIRQYEKAERKISDIESAESRNALYDELHISVGLFELRNKNWDEFEKRTEKLSSKNYKAMMYLKALSATDSTLPRNSLFDYIARADKNIDAISDKTAKASAAICLASVIFSLENTDNFRDVPAAIGIINQAPDYSENSFQIEVKIPPKGSTFGEYIGNTTFRDLFTRLAVKDWNDSQLQALQIKSSGLQAIAQVTAAKAVLQKLKAAK